MDPRIIFINSNTTSLAKAIASTKKIVLKDFKINNSRLLVLEMIVIKKIVLKIMMLKRVILETLRCFFPK